MAQFYCFLENVYLCDECFEEHAYHGVEMADSIKNHLCRFFNEWLNLHDYVVNVTQRKLDAIIEKDRNMLMMLRLKSQV